MTEPRRSLPRIRIKAPVETSEVGYGRPPSEHQFKPGQSGNPRGRRKGIKNEATILRELLSRKITIREGQRARKVSVLEAMLLRVADDSIKGNIKSIAFLLNRHLATASGDTQTTELNEDEQTILEAYSQRLLSQHKHEKKS